MSEKTFRVPRRVQEQAELGMQQLASFDGLSGDAFRIATLLSSGKPVGSVVPASIVRFFAATRYPVYTTPEALLYGGEVGQEWASRCQGKRRAAKSLVAAAKTEPEDSESLDLDDDAVDMLIAFAQSLRDVTQTPTEEFLVEEPGEEVAAEITDDSQEERSDDEEFTAVSDFSLADTVDQLFAAQERLAGAQLQRTRRALSARMARTNIFTSAAPETAGPPAAPSPTPTSGVEGDDVDPKV